jgi:replicative DNA helicase
VSELYDLSLERHVLGAAILKPSLLATFGLEERAFYSDAHAIIWRAMLDLLAKAEPVNTLTLRAKLLDLGKLQTVGGDQYLLDLTDTIPVDAVPAERLNRLGRVRATQEALQRLLAVCATGDLDRIVEGLGEAHRAAMAGGARNASVNVLDLCATLLEELAHPIDERKLIHPGYTILADQLGLIPTQTNIGILANTNVGKSTFCLEMLVRMAQRGICVGYLSVEDQKPRVRARIASMLSGVPSWKILQHKVEREDMGVLARAFNEIDRIKNNLHVSVLQGGTDTDVCAAQSELAGKGCRAVAIDYLQKISPSRERDSRAQEVANMATRITSHGQRLDLVTFLVSQCTRDKTRQNECPSKHDMKESGDLENMLDAIIGLWREFEDDRSPTWARLIKTKDGGVGRSWCLKRDEAGRLNEIECSDRMTPPDQTGDWAHRSQQQKRRSA